MKRGGFAYLGLIGSDRKWKRFRARLLQRGFDERDLQRVQCPIGLSKSGKEPRAIALSVAAQISHQLAMDGARDDSRVTSPVVESVTSIEAS